MLLAEKNKTINLKTIQKQLKMKSKSRELKSYINGTERMSGFDSNAEGEMGYFNDESGADGEYAGSYADGGTGSMQSQEYIVSYYNSTSATVTCILFGFNDYATSTNYGNPTTVTVTNVQGGTYGRLINQSNNKNFQIGQWRFISTTSSQLTQSLTINYVDANGDVMQKPFTLSVLKDPYQFQSDTLDIRKTITIDANTFLTFPLLATTTLTIAMWPNKILSGKAKLNGLSGDGRFSIPRVSGKNAANVVIQTSQDVKSITK